MLLTLFIYLWTESVPMDHWMVREVEVLGSIFSIVMMVMESA